MEGRTLARDSWPINPIARCAPGPLTRHALAGVPSAALAVLTRPARLCSWQTDRHGLGRASTSWTRRASMRPIGAPPSRLEPAARACALAAQRVPEPPGPFKPRTQASSRATRSATTSRPLPSRSCRPLSLSLSRARVRNLAVSAWWWRRCVRFVRCSVQRVYSLERAVASTCREHGCVACVVLIQCAGARRCRTCAPAVLLAAYPLRTS